MTVTLTLKEARLLHRLRETDEDAYTRQINVIAQVEGDLLRARNQHDTPDHDRKETYLGSNKKNPEILTPKGKRILNLDDYDEVIVGGIRCKPLYLNKHTGSVIYQPLE